MLVIVACSVRSAAGQARIDFELAMEAGNSPASARQWIELFKDLERTGVRVRSAKTSEQPQARNLGTDTAPQYHVLGIITNRQRLLLPGGRAFGVRDRAGIEQWIALLREDGVAGLTAERGTFGLTKEELVALHGKLSRPVSFATRGQSAGSVAKRLVLGLAVQFEVTPRATQEFAHQDQVGDELQGLSSGTALAATLRPLGLVAAAQRKQGEVSLRIAAASEVEEFWPVGWPPSQPPVRTAPTLFEYTDVEIVDVSLQRALNAIQERIKLPLLLDHSALARQQVDLEAKQISFPEQHTFYKRVLDNLLFQARLTSDLRVDDAGKPFLWITSTQR
jgi:hypothetical protein